VVARSQFFFASTRPTQVQFSPDGEWLVSASPEYLKMFDLSDRARKSA
jgi:hypothetical protein